MAVQSHSPVRIYLCLSCLLVLGLLTAAAAQTFPDEDEEGDRRGTRPRTVTAEVVNSTMISLSWKHPKIATEHCPVKRYVLRLKQEGARRSRAWKVDGARRALGLHNLKPDTLYSIRLVAITCEGKGKPTKWLEIMTSVSKREAAKAQKAVGQGEPRLPREEPSGIETRPPGRPTYVRTRTFPDSVILTWQAPSETDIMVRGYMVGYGEGVPDVNWQYVDANQRNVTIKNLKPSTQYIISLRAFNNKGKGPTVYDMIYTRELMAPTVDPSTTQTPEHLRAKVLSPTNVWLQWHDPSLGIAQQITDDRYYNVHYQSLPDGEKLSVVVKALHVVLYELTPGTTYEFTVRTVKDSFYSEFSDPIRNTTFETAPESSPRSLRVTPNNDSVGVLVQWRPPRQSNGHIIGYVVLHSSERVKPIAEWNALATADTSATIESLEPGQTYYFKVQARNSVGYGPLSKTTVYTAPTGEQADIHLSPSHDQSVQVQSVYADFDTGAAPNNTAPEAGEMLALSAGAAPPNASADSPSEPTVKTKRHDASSNTTAAPQGATSQALKAKPAKSDVQFVAKVLHTISAFITWPSAPPSCDCDVTSIQYLFHLYMRGKEEAPQMHHLEANMVHIEDLDPNERYHYQMKYIFPNGTESGWSQEQALDTNCHGQN